MDDGRLIMSGLFPPVDGEVGPEDVLDLSKGLHPGLTLPPVLLILLVVPVQLLDAARHLLLAELVNGCLEFCPEVVQEFVAPVLELVDESGHFDDGIVELLLVVGVLWLVLEVGLEPLVDLLHLLLLHE